MNLPFIEVSTPFVNLRWAFYVFNMKEKQSYLITSVLMSLTFFIARTIPLPFIVYYGVFKEGKFLLNGNIDL